MKLAKLKFTHIGQEGDSFDHIVIMSTDVPAVDLGNALKSVVDLAESTGHDMTDSTIVITFGTVDAPNN